MPVVVDPRVELQLFRRGPLVRVPGLTEEQRRVLGELMMLEAGPRIQAGVGFEQARSGLTRVLRALLRLGLIEVVGLGPARYRVTRVGRLARGLGVTAQEAGVQVEYDFKIRRRLAALPTPRYR